MVLMVLMVLMVATILAKMAGADYSKLCLIVNKISAKYPRKFRAAPRPGGHV